VLHKPSNDALKVPAVHLLPIVFETWHTPGETLSKAPPDSRAKAGFLTLPLLFDDKEEKIVLFPSLWLKNLFQKKTTYLSHVVRRFFYCLYCF